MAFALTGFYADGIRYNGPGPKHAEQVVYLQITAADTDTALDISDSAGTFWTDVEADATYGALGTAAASVVFNQLAAVNDGLLSISLVDNLNYYQGAAASGVIYTVVMTDSLPDLLFASGSAPTGYTVVLKFVLTNGSEPVSANLGTLA